MGVSCVRGETDWQRGHGEWYGYHRWELCTCECILGLLTGKVYAPKGEGQTQNRMKISKNKGK